MSIPELCERIQNTWVSRAISESTWGYPIVGALHVLAIALFGMAMLIPHIRLHDSDLDTDGRWIRRIGMSLVLISGVLVFSSGAARYYESTSFRIKMGLLALIALNAVSSRRHRSRFNSAVTMVLWAAMIFASRGIAFF
jgi:hypothetical protein